MPRSPSPTSEPFVPEHPHLQALNDAISSKALPCSSGVFAVQPDDLILYYGTKEPNSKGLGRIDFTSHTDDEIKHLADSCDVATFGRGGEDVHDESYRKAGKLDKRHFASNFCPELSGLMHVIRHNVLEGHNGKALKVELYKLNVYGPGSFFKAHKDTPRADNMIASLVVVLPTRHDGGALVLRHEGREFKFESAKILAQPQAPSVAYAAFYGDVEHEVEPVVSGSRVTLTYNIYLIDSVTKHVQPDTAYELALKDAFRALLQDKEYLPEGGLVGFGLRHEYPIDVFSVTGRYDDRDREQWTVDKLLGTLKGSDAILQKACADLGLKASLRILYFESQSRAIAMSKCVMYAGYGGGEDVWFTEEVVSDGFGVLIRDYQGKTQATANENDTEANVEANTEDENKKLVTVHWATRMRASDIDKIVTPTIAYGNNAFLYKVYSTLCLIVEVEPAESRLIVA
ncbi:2OG-Fe(II) oxygenase [Phanerochaete sordida]|uniref:2OG-Fe(II) oxygenase n=1 Tax=Phanerochaete sordida TaxID=48140 RepID=A0A9P3LKX0_9APHY|nr:2OG-Fe(II) oxygenase [Phanerochaete sordida]